MQYKSYNLTSNQWYYPTMDAPKLIGNTGSVISWDSIINSIKDKTGKPVNNRQKWDHPHRTDMHKMFVKSNYSMFSSEWINYYPGKDYDDSTIEKFGNIVGYSNHVRSWISRVDPGKTAPWHWDIDDNEIEYLAKGKLIRFVCKISKFDLGHVTLIGDGVLTGGQGDIYCWADHRQWHGSANCGLTSKFQFNYLAWYE